MKQFLIGLTSALCVCALAPFAGLGQPAAAAKHSSDLPPAQDIVKKFVKAMGGEQAIKRHTSHHTKGTYELPAMGLKGELDIQAARPNKVLVKVTMPGMGDILTGYDGKVGWSLNPATGPMLMEGAQLVQMADDYNFYAVLHEPGTYKTMETVEKTDFEGEPCYKVKIVRNSGVEDFEYFHRETGLQVGSEVTREGPTGTVKVINLISDYKTFADVLIPTRMTQKILGMQQVMNFTSVEFDKVKDSVFALPDQIKPLVKKP